MVPFMVSGCRDTDPKIVFLTLWDLIYLWYSWPVIIPQKEMGETFPALARNAVRILTSIKMLEINISDLIDLKVIIHKKMSSLCFKI
jgi:hypothetical protein